MTKLYKGILISLLLILSFWIWVGMALSAVYYVDSVNGLDTNTGTDTAHPWKTIAKVNESSFRPDDRVLFLRGNTWREQLTVPSAGTSGHPITFGAYGMGDKPIISSDVVSSAVAEETGGVFAAGFETETDLMTTEFTGKSALSSNTVSITTANGTVNYGEKAAEITMAGTSPTAYVYKTIAGQTEAYVRGFFKPRTDICYVRNRE